MPKKVSSKKKGNKVTMREAFAFVSPKVSSKNGKNSKKDNPIREFFWNYPDHLLKFVKFTNPLSTILIFALVGFLISNYLRSDTFAERISSSNSNTYVEGRVGAISTLNPLFSNQNDIDKSIQELVFEKFIYINSSEEILPGIANSWDIKEGGKVYEFDIDLNHTWSDGTPLTVEDVQFTFETAIQLSTDQGYDTVGSGIEDVSVEVVDNDTIRFELPEINSLFPELVSVYIVPKHVLSEVSLSNMPFDRFSRNPVGSGPYRVFRSEPNIVTLQSSEYFKPEVSIENITVKIYSSVEKLESAFRSGVLDAALLLDDKRSDFVNEYASFESHKLNLPYRQRMIFFNLRKEKFQSQDLRRAITMLIDKEQMLEDSGVEGEIINGPICSVSWAYCSDIEYIKYDPDSSRELLEGIGYSKNETNGYFETEDGKLLTFTLSYLENEINNLLLNTLADLLANEGVIMNLEPLTYSQLTQEILATRNFEALMYEIEVTVDPDQYNLWHSLQKEYPNLNLSGYEFSRVDILLEEGRREIDKEERREDYRLFQKYIVQDAPAIFLYRPSYIYVVRDSLSGTNFEDIVRLEDIYRDINIWNLEK
jgi:peptide/nickel transport system substrate-binding protein